MIITEQGPMKEGPNGGLVPIPIENGAMSINNIDLYKLENGLLEVSMSEPDLDKFSQVMYGGRKFNPGIDLEFPVPIQGTQHLGNVSEIKPFDNLVNPAYKITGNEITIDLSGEKTLQNTGSKRNSLVDKLKSFLPW
jgi:hypothetical protein